MVLTEGWPKEKVFFSGEKIIITVSVLYKVYSLLVFLNKSERRFEKVISRLFFFFICIMVIFCRFFVFFSGLVMLNKKNFISFFWLWIRIFNYEEKIRIYIMYINGRLWEEMDGNEEILGYLGRFFWIICWSI